MGYIIIIYEEEIVLKRYMKYIKGMVVLFFKR